MGCMKCTSIIIIFLCPSRKRSADYLMFGRSSNIRPNVHFLHGAGLTSAIFGFHVRVTLIKFFLLLLKMSDFPLPCLPCTQWGASNQNHACKLPFITKWETIRFLLLSFTRSFILPFTLHCFCSSFSQLFFHSLLPCFTSSSKLNNLYFISLTASWAHFPLHQPWLMPVSEKC